MTTIRVGRLTYDPVNVIGTGSSGNIVFRGSLSNASWMTTLLWGDQQSVAIKRVQKSYRANNESEWQREVEVMKRTNHPNIIRLIWTETNIDFLYIATELCRGTLDEYVNGKYKGPRFMSEREILRQVTQGLAHLHSLRIIHRDIKPTNILIFVPDECNDDTRPQIKLADFGISKVSSSADTDDFTNTSVTNPNGTKGWMAPEVYQFKRFDFKVDIWALGCIFAYMLTGGKHPFGDDSNERIVRIIRKEPMLLIPSDLKVAYSKDGGTVFNLIKFMLEMEPNLRPSLVYLEKSLFFSIDPVQTQEFLNICHSLSNSSTADTILQFEQVLEDETVDVNATTPKGITPLNLCSKNCSAHPKLMNILWLLIEKGADVTTKTKDDGSTPLYSLCLNYKYDNLIFILDLLLHKGADVNAKLLGTGWTPLHALCRFYMHDNLIYLVKMMIESGAEVDAKTNDGRTPLMLLFYDYQHSNLIDIVELMVKKGASSNVRDCLKGMTPLHLLCQNYRNSNLGDIAKFLLVMGADVNAHTDEGMTPLHYLCTYYDNENLIDIVKLFKRKGAYLNVRSSNGSKPITILLQKGLLL